MAEHASGDLKFDDWLTPEAALGILPQTWEYKTKVNWISDRLNSGLIIAEARIYQSGNDSIISDRAHKISKEIWRECDYHREHDFWRTGDVTFTKTIWDDDYIDSTSTVGTAFDVRFNPAGFSSFTPKPVPTETPTLDPPLVPLKNLSDDNAKRFSRAILEGWPDSTERDAVAKARLFFPDNAVPRDWFLGIFRSIRGLRKPGKPGKTAD